MKKSLILLCLGLALSWGGESAQLASPVQIKQIFVDTAENSSVKGDAIVIQFNQAMNRSNWVDNRISHTAQNTPKAPAGYTQPANSQSARNAARNYTVKITSFGFTHSSLHRNLGQFGWFRLLFAANCLPQVIGSK